MNKLMEWLKNDFSPKMNKVNNNVWIVTLKDSVMQLLPFILLGSVFCLLTIPGDVYQIKNYPNFWVPFGWTMGMLSLLVSFLIPFNLMEKKKLRKQRFIAGCTSLIVFLIIITPQVVKDGAVGFSHSSLGTGGMFVAIIAALFTGYIMSLFGKFSFSRKIPSSRTLSEPGLIPCFPSVSLWLWLGCWSISFMLIYTTSF